MAISRTRSMRRSLRASRFWTLGKLSLWLSRRLSHRLSRRLSRRRRSRRRRSRRRRSRRLSRWRQMQHVHSMAVIVAPLDAAREQAANVIARTITGPVAMRHASHSQGGVTTTTSGCTHLSPCGIARCSPSPLLLLLPQQSAFPRCGTWIPTSPRCMRDAQRMGMIADILVAAPDAGVSVS